MAERDWHAWHASYDQPGSLLSRRLAAVQERLRLALDDAPAGPLRLLSLVAGQGRDVIPVLAAHPRRPDVRACLVELDPDIAQTARQAAAAADLSTVDIRVGDAALVDGYADAVPADILLLCGLFGNISDGDIRHTIEQSAALTKQGGTVIWTRHRRPPDLVPQIDTWFAERGFDTEWISAPGLDFGVGAHRLRRSPRPLAPGTRLFEFGGAHR
jgi:hypothetical protein